MQLQYCRRKSGQRTKVDFPQITKRPSISWENISALSNAAHMRKGGCPFISPYPRASRNVGPHAHLPYRAPLVVKSPRKLTASCRLENRKIVKEECVRMMKYIVNTHNLVGNIKSVFASKSHD
ncbi:unnamed protein product [Nezara viridula]|uniref:Uncharacterized protein n=1 Tax=Nezara viridula TaxID=85310 RepID=A0A9P0H792_NEZVI|nr:unnamed protein product [Nezara viridula]